MTGNGKFERVCEAEKEKKKCECERRGGNYEKDYNWCCGR